ncbi:hypothetical protein XM53_15355 [Roseovarius atlanticus]|uniref:Uncharacterized protein n=1 Tax=Roseovarius atlanticus TaxID=1641875 RepID=A0A0T5NS90_9RHOB|nr:hypothetical protein [Roseovarius atlanticus]KRS11648.1 hypothetical protein XM53_15355 [Roseovarius atlanticus]
MPPRPISRLLHILAEETDDLAGIAQRLDTLIPELVTHLPESATADLRDLQRVDALWQHLRDISRVLKTVSTSVEADARLDVTPLLAQVRLDYFRHRLLDDPVKPDLGRGDGQPILF